MSGASGMIIRVKTQELVSISGEVETQINTMRQLFDQVNDIVSRSNSYWEGDGQNAYRQSYQGKCGEIEIALRRFAENVMDLQTIAGVYEAAEAAAVEETAFLREDVIV